MYSHFYLMFALPILWSHHVLYMAIADGEDTRESRKRGKASRKEAQLCGHEEEGKRKRRLSGL